MQDRTNRTRLVASSVQFGPSKLTDDSSIETPGLLDKTGDSESSDSSVTNDDSDDDTYTGLPDLMRSAISSGSDTDNDSDSGSDTSDYSGSDVSIGLPGWVSRECYDTSDDSDSDASCSGRPYDLNRDISTIFSDFSDDDDSTGHKSDDGDSGDPGRSRAGLDPHPGQLQPRCHAASDQPG